MSFSLRPAIRENVGLIIGLAGGTGSGKTYTAMRLAAGISQGKPFAVIDTEAGRAKHYADMFRFDHGDLTPPFRPEAYTEAVKACEAAGYPVIVIDSASHEHAGEGGLLDWAEEELTRMAGDDWKKREACLQASWIKPKGAHKRMVQKMLQVRCHLILCLRAEEKTELQKIDGKWKMVPKVTRTGLDGWVPVCEKTLPFELTASFLLTAEAPGVPRPIKLQEQHKALFPLDRPITEESGRQIADWASGSKTMEGAENVTDRKTSSQLKGAPAGAGAPDAAAEYKKALKDSESVVELQQAWQTIYKVYGSQVPAELEVAKNERKAELAKGVTA